MYMWLRYMALETGNMNKVLRESAPSLSIFNAGHTAQQCNGCTAPYSAYQAGEKCPFGKDLIWDPSAVSSFFVKVVLQKSGNSEFTWVGQAKPSRSPAEWWDTGRGEEASRWFSLTHFSCSLAHLQWPRKVRGRTPETLLRHWNAFRKGEMLAKHVLAWTCPVNECL